MLMLPTYVTRLPNGYALLLQARSSALETPRIQQCYDAYKAHAFLQHH